MPFNKPIRRVAIVGAGVIGASWTAQYLARGFDVVATDPAPNAEDNLRKYVDEAWEQLTVIGLSPGAARDRLTAGTYIPRDPEEPVAVLEAALRAVIAAESIGARIREARSRGVITSTFADPMVDEAAAKGVITQAEKETMERAKLLRRRVIMVDDFPKDLGKTEIHQTTQPVTFEALRGRTSWPELETRDHEPSPAP